MRFLSPDWLTALDHALSSSEAVRTATAETSLRLLQIVTGTPEGDVGYLIAVDRGRVQVTAAAPGEPADVTLSSDWPTAVAIANGELAPNDAFTTGILRIAGNIDILRAQAPALAGLSSASEEVRAQTIYA